MASRGCKTVEFPSNGGIIRARIYGGTEVLLDDVLVEDDAGARTLGFDQWLATQPAGDQRAIRLEVEGEARLKAQKGESAAVEVEDRATGLHVHWCERHDYSGDRPCFGCAEASS